MAESTYSCLPERGRYRLFAACGNHETLIEYGRLTLECMADIVDGMSLLLIQDKQDVHNKIREVSKPPSTLTLFETFYEIVIKRPRSPKTYKADRHL